MGICSKICVQKNGIKMFKELIMNSSAGEEILSAAGVPETNQVTVATVTTTSTTNTQTVAGTRAGYIPLFTSYIPQQSLPYYSYQSSGYGKVLLITKSAPLTFLGQIMQLHLSRYKRLTMYIAWMTMQTMWQEEPMRKGGFLKQE